MLWMYCWWCIRCSTILSINRKLNALMQHRQMQWSSVPNKITDNCGVKTADEWRCSGRRVSCQAVRQARDSVRRYIARSYSVDRADVTLIARSGATRASCLSSTVYCLFICSWLRSTSVNDSLWYTPLLYALILQANTLSAWVLTLSYCLCVSVKPVNQYKLRQRRFCSFHLNSSSFGTA